MGCGSCATTGSGAPKGCKSNGHCATGGCNKLNVYDWLSDMELPSYYKPLNINEIRFKGSRKEFYRNANGLEIYTGDLVVVQAENGYDIGHISVSGELVRLQLKKYNIDPDSAEMLQIMRKANDKDTERYEELKAKEAPTLETARTIALELNLQMKLSDIEIRGDGKKVTFFYTAEDRVDFRELIKRYADLFRMRIEMRQIGYRQEASRLGGIGSCGRELCCSTWLTDFKVVNISAARYQNLSINMLKLSGQCGRLKCCLNYELDTYVEALGEFPKGEDALLKTRSGTAKVQKTDILKRMMWFAYEGSSEWFALDLKSVNEIIAKNRNGELADDIKAPKEEASGIQKFMQEDVIAASDLTRLDKDDEDELKKEQQRRNRNNRGGDRRQHHQNKSRDGQDRNQNRGDQQRNRERGGDQHKDNRNRPPQQQQNNRNRGQENRNRPPQGNQGNQQPPSNNNNGNNNNRNRPPRDKK